MTQPPIFEGDLFAEEVLADSNPTYRALRDLGAAVWHPNLNAYTVARFTDADPDRFVVTRNPTDPLGWGHGVHLCSGMHLARLEMEVVLRALLKRVSAIEAGPPTRIINYSAQGYATLPLRLHPAAT